MKALRFLLLGLLVLAGVWTRPSAGSDRGLAYSHEAHFAVLELACTDCHGMEPAERSLPNHQVCSICHETEQGAEDAIECSYCHTRDDNTVDPLTDLFSDEIKFGHEPHRERQCSDCHSRAEMLEKRMPADPSEAMDGPEMPSCQLCHPDPDGARLVASPAKVFCVECHQQMGDSRAECTICHTTITREAGGH